MKFTACLLCILTAAACATQSKQEVKSATNSDTFYPPSYTPPNSFPELTVLDTRNNPVQPVIVVEDGQEKYEASIQRINEEIQNEGLTVQMYAAMCKEDKKDCKKYKEYLKNACSIDVLIDTKGDQYRKPYCTP